MSNEEALDVLNYIVGNMAMEFSSRGLLDAVKCGRDALKKQNISQLANEADPVRHGHWIHTGETNIFGGHQHKCSVCGYSLMVSKACDNENYCCSCGAKMDEVTG